MTMPTIPTHGLTSRLYNPAMSGTVRFLEKVAERPFFLKGALDTARSDVGSIDVLTVGGPRDGGRNPGGSPIGGINALPGGGGGRMPPPGGPGGILGVVFVVGMDQPTKSDAHAMSTHTRQHRKPGGTGHRQNTYGTIHNQHTCSWGLLSRAGTAGAGAGT